VADVTADVETTEAAVVDAVVDASVLANVDELVAAVVEIAVTLASLVVVDWRVVVTARVMDVDCDTEALDELVLAMTCATVEVSTTAVVRAVLAEEVVLATVEADVLVTSERTDVVAATVDVSPVVVAADTERVRAVTEVETVAVGPVGGALVVAVARLVVVEARVVVATVAASAVEARVVDTALARVVVAAVRSVAPKDKLEPLLEYEDAVGYQVE
jgi:hypothetical protein